MKRFWNWVETETERTLEINGAIAEESWYDDDVTPKMFKKELNSGKGDIRLYINSPGGDCVAASQIYTMLMEYPYAVNVIIDGIAASAASVIAMAGTTVTMSPTAMLMIHNPMTLAYGNTDEMQKAIAVLDEVKEAIINAYEIKTGLSRKKISKLMDAETWMNAKKAVEMNFADEILSDGGNVNANAYDYAAKSANTTLLNKIKAKTKTQTEKAPSSVGRSVDDLLAILKSKI